MSDEPRLSRGLPGTAQLVDGLRLTGRGNVISLPRPEPLLQPGGPADSAGGAT
jgi:hypothetical protein